MILSSIAAMSKNRAIGKDNKLPWHLPEDLKFFKEKTLGKIIIMGRKTFESVGRPLPKRTNFIVTRDSQFKVEGAEVFSTLDSALEAAASRAAKDEEVFIVGGGEIYKQLLPRTQRLYLTLVDMVVDGDAFFPEVDLEKEFRITKSREVLGQPSYTFIEADRR